MSAIDHADRLVTTLALDSDQVPGGARYDRDQLDPARTFVLPRPLRHEFASASGSSAGSNTEVRGQSGHPEPVRENGPVSTHDDLGPDPRVLSPVEWRAAAAAYRERFDRLAGPYLERRAAGTTHPVIDFLFT